MLRVTEVVPAGEELDLGLAADATPCLPVVGIDADSAGAEPITEVAARLRQARAITVAVASSAAAPAWLSAAVDLTIAPTAYDMRTVAVADATSELAALDGVSRVHPQAAIGLAWLLRGTEHLDVWNALAAESALYSTLLAGPDFAGWLARRGPTRPPDGPERVRLHREGDTLHVTLTRSARRNAVDSAMRHALLEALDLARWDNGLRVEIDAEGPDFCAGGDLDEFGHAPDPATAHLIRVAASAGGVLSDLRERVTVRVHGACLGAGVELPSFGGRVVAAGNSSFGLPELSMGLIPGAGGTVSLPRRIGRWRTLWLALRGARLDAATALEWGLVDELG
jgi:Enoyl-CoA hydratase/isomerase